MKISDIRQHMLLVEEAEQEMEAAEGGVDAVPAAETAAAEPVTEDNAPVEPAAEITEDEAVDERADAAEAPVAEIAEDEAVAEEAGTPAPSGNASIRELMDVVEQAAQEMEEVSETEQVEEAQVFYSATVFKFLSDIKAARDIFKTVRDDADFATGVKRQRALETGDEMLRASVKSFNRLVKEEPPYATAEEQKKECVELSADMFNANQDLERLAGDRIADPSEPRQVIDDVINEMPDCLDAWLNKVKSIQDAIPNHTPPVTEYSTGPTPNPYDFGKEPVTEADGGELGADAPAEPVQEADEIDESAAAAFPQTLAGIEIAMREWMDRVTEQDNAAAEAKLYEFCSQYVDLYNEINGTAAEPKLHGYSEVVAEGGEPLSVQGFEEIFNETETEPAEVAENQDRPLTVTGFEEIFNETEEPVAEDEEPVTEEDDTLVIDDEWDGVVAFPR